MDKNFIKHITTVAAALALMLPFFSCNDDKEKEENLPPAQVYFVDSKAEEANIHDLAFLDIGEEYGLFNLALYKAGVDNSAATAKIAVLTEAELAEYNEKQGKDFVLITPESYSIEGAEVTFSGQYNDLNKEVPVAFNLAKLRLENEKAVLPLKIAESSIVISEDKSLIVIRPKVRDALISFADGGVKHSKTYLEGESEDLSFDILALLEIEDNKWDVEVEVEVATDYVAQYIQDYGGNYQLWPAGSYTLETTKTISAGEKSASFAVHVAGEDLAAGQYLLPVRLKRSSQFKIDENSLFYIKMDIRAPAPPATLDRTGWTIASLSTEEPEGEDNGNNGKAIHTLDNNLSTFWHSRWKNKTAADALPHWFVIDMQQEYVLTAVALTQRQGNNIASKNGELWISSTTGNGAATEGWIRIGTFELQQISNEQVIPVTPTAGCYLKVVVTSSWHHDNISSFAEVKPAGY